MNTTIRLLLIFSITASLMGCGGGGGGGSVSSTVIDNFNMTEGQADDKLGETYITEFLEDKGYDTEVSEVYSRLYLSGVEEAHKSGWTGKGKTMTVLDSGFSSASDHGTRVSYIARAVAPAATINEYTSNDVLGDASKKLSALESEVVTISMSITALNDYIQSLLDSLVSDMKSSDALVTLAASHSNWEKDKKISFNDGLTITGRGGYQDCPTPSPDNGEMTVEVCSSWAAAGLDTDNVIYVGEVYQSGDNIDKIPPWSNQAGDKHKHQFLVTSSDTVTDDSNGRPGGNSFAAPRVAGTGALVRHKFPNLTAPQTATVILHTADDLGEAGVDEVYGHGRLNVGSALSPVGNLH